ncbi:dipeptidyl-peptidase-4 [Streptomyces sp. DvalAA-14]|uniref:S9 family peptidase n=1 Tax=unclassified Streptomyces TaxID=2593676 RepID=UPI00081B4879|nr:MULTISPECIES: prolyl oligopeptidase family serine peptidase [unclassified Streptomyces]MYS21438.1 prolyl oligopeptidase family serine peptidase [Streptomyces sp. SID4948]SCD92718.1 dipeptidyl-peptidase-4 [Streptomyces sp. DvalAA-14]
MTQLSFPRQTARTQRFTLGAPRSFVIAPDGERVAFLRSRSGTERALLLWVLDVPAAGAPEGAEGAAGERIVADPAQLLGGGAERLSAAERARRERSRERSAGVVGFAVDSAAQWACFALSGRLFVAGLRPGAASPREVAVPGPVVDPRLSPDGRWVAYASAGALRVVAAAGGDDRALAEPDEEHVSWGVAEFVAAEEMGRSRGFWWSPDSAALLAARVDESPVQRWWISEPAHPDRAPVPVRYPAAGTANAEVSLALFGLDGSRREVVWDRGRYPYLAAVHWSAGAAPLLLVQSRDQREQRCLTVDPATGATTVELIEEDQIWLDLFPGSPTRIVSGELVRITDEADARVLKVGAKTLTDGALQLRAVLDAGGTAQDGPDVLVTAAAGERAADPEIGQVHVYQVGAAGAVRVSEQPGVHTAVRGGGLTVLTSSAPDRPGPRTAVLRGGRVIAEVASYTQAPSITARPRLLEAGARRIPTAVLLPTGYAEGDGPLPVLLDPYGGPHGQRVLAAHNAHVESQWWADQGFAVIVADGRGTPGRSPGWEKSIAGDFAGVSVADQIDALHALAGPYPLDLTRVAIRGWSYGGYLAALAALRRPDVFHAAVVGAPVTDLRMYDTHYMERYLGHPDERPEVYAANSVLTDDGITDLASPARPMMIIHGLADDNVLVAHSLRLSGALLTAGRPHEVLPLSGVTHMASQEQVAENLLLLQVDFLRRSLSSR